VNRLVILARLLELGSRYAQGQDVRAELRELERSMGEPPQLKLLGEPGPAEPSAPGPSLKEATGLVFAHWQKRCNHPKARLTPERAGKIMARLKQGYSVDDLLAAVDGCASSAFHSGTNETGAVYDDIELICRNGSNVERFAAMAGARFEPAPSTPEAQAQARRAELMAEAERHLREGNTSEYNRILRSVRAGKGS
jgi:hypothetical protein